MLRSQGFIAVAVPWLVASVIAPGSLWWGAVSLVIPIIFTLVNARDPQVWVAPVSGAVQVLPGLPLWLTTAVAAAAALVLVLRPPVSLPSGVLAQKLSRPTLRWSIAGALVVVSIGLIGFGFQQERQREASFTAGQQTAAQQWSVQDDTGTDAMSKPLDDSDLNFQELNSSGATTLVGAPTHAKERAVIPVEPPLATLRFTSARDNSPIVTDATLYVGSDVSDEGLAAGPGHYPGTAKPGRKGNVAIAGHRVGWGSPFRNLHELEPGDEIELTDRKGDEHVYVVDSSVLVPPDASWVLGADPLGTGERTLTLTTCDPPGINTERLIVFATLKDATQA